MNLRSATGIRKAVIDESTNFLQAAFQGQMCVAPDEQMPALGFRALREGAEVEVGAEMIEGVTREQLESLLAIWKIGYIRLEADYRIRAVNPEIVRLVGRPADDLLGKLIWEIWPAAENSGVGELIRGTMASRRGAAAGVYTFARKDREACVDLRVHPWGEGVAVFTLDVSEKEEVERENEALEHRYLLASRALDVFYEWDVVNDVSRLTEEGARALGLPTVVMSPGSTLAGRFHPEDKDKAIATLEDALKSGRAQWENKYRIWNGQKYVLMHERNFGVYDDAGKPLRIVGALSDISEAQEAQVQIQNLQSELIHMSRLSAMGTMASVLGHELNQPLAAAGSYLAGVENLLNSKDPPSLSVLKQGITRAREAVSRAGEIIRRLRAMTKKSMPRWDRTNIATAVKNAVTLSLIGQHHLESTLAIAVPEGLEIEADAIQIEQVLINLIRNAFDANEESGTSGVHISARKADEATVEISVADHGPGLPPKVMESLFDFFMSTKTKGLGIGLPISRTIVEAHGGRISATNRDGGGAVFTLSLPIEQNRV